MDSWQNGLKPALSRFTCPPLPRASCPQCSLWHTRVSDRSIIGLLPRASLSQVSVRHSRVSGLPKSVSFRRSGGSLIRPPCSQCSLGHPRVSGLPEIGLFPAFRRFSATGILPTVLSGAWSRVRAVNYRPSATATPATGICEALPRVRPSRNRSFSGTSAGLCHGHPAHSALWGMVAWQNGQLLAFCHAHPRHRYL